MAACMSRIYSAGHQHVLSRAAELGCACRAHVGRGGRVRKKTAHTATPCVVCCVGRWSCCVMPLCDVSIARLIWMYLCCDRCAPHPPARARGEKVAYKHII
eukprot:scaffold12209_cov134-Isochrysis_galbana.AAC.4